MNFVKTLSRLQLNKHPAIHDQVSHIVSHNLSFVAHSDGNLLLHLKSERGKFNGQGIFVNLFQKTTAQSVCNPVSATDHLMGQ